MDRLRSFPELDDESARALADDANVATIVLDGLARDVASETVDALRARGADARAHADDEATRLFVVSPRAPLATLSAERSDGVGAAARELLRAFDAGSSRPQTVRARARSLDLTARARVMGILNVTPDSFYDRGAFAAVDRARERAREMVAAGADLIDIGGQSYAHWNPRIAAEEERARVVPVVEALVRDGIGVPLSIDTFKASVADAALAAGADLINDCSGLSDPELAPVVARYDAGLVVMHLKGRLNERDAAYTYDDAMGEIVGFLRERCDRARECGVAADALIVDPGLEFGKEPETDLEILERFGDLRSLGYPILLAASRKSFIGRIFDRPAKVLLVPSLTTAMIGIAAGAGMIRAHDVAETVQLATMLAAVRSDHRGKLRLAAAMPGTPAAVAVANGKTDG